METQKYVMVLLLLSFMLSMGYADINNTVTLDNNESDLWGISDVMKVMRELEEEDRALKASKESLKESEKTLKASTMAIAAQ